MVRIVLELNKIRSFTVKILALAFFGIIAITPCFSCVISNEFNQIGLSVQEVYYEGHDYIVINCKRTNSTTILHSPECVKCKNWYAIDTSTYFSCVEVQKNGNYFVDSSGKVELV